MASASSSNLHSAAVTWDDAIADFMLLVKGTREEKTTTFYSMTSFSMSAETTRIRRPWLASRRTDAISVRVSSGNVNAARSLASDLDADAERSFCPGRLARSGEPFELSSRAADEKERYQTFNVCRACDDFPLELPVYLLTVNLARKYCVKYCLVQSEFSITSVIE